MEEGHKNSLTELSENSRAKISHDPNTRAKERIKYSSDDILDETVAGNPSELFVNIKAPDPDAKEELAKTRNTVRQRFVAPVANLFSKKNRVATISVISATCLGIILLTVPPLFKQPSPDDLYAINPETGLTNKETQWLNFTNTIRSTVSTIRTPEATEPETAVLNYFHELLEDYPGVADRMDIRVLEAEYYLNYGQVDNALNVIVAADTNYEQPADNDPDLPAYFDRILRYYNLRRDIFELAGEQGNAEDMQRIIDSILDEKQRTMNVVFESDKTEEE